MKPFKVKEGKLHLIGLRESIKKTQALVQKRVGKRSLVRNLKQLRQEGE